MTGESTHPTRYQSVCRWSFHPGKGGFVPSGIRPGFAGMTPEGFVELVREKIAPRVPSNTVLGLAVHYEREACEKTATGLVEALKGSGLFLSMISPGAHYHFAYGGIGSPDPAERKAAGEFAVRALELLAGPLSDRFGRKRVLSAGLLANGLAALGFYNLDGWLVPLCWGVMVMTVTLSLVLFAALGSELFPTSYRSTASGARAVIATFGAATGLALQGVLFGLTGSHAAAISWMLVLVPLAPLVVLLFLPETANRELEEVSPER